MFKKIICLFGFIFVLLFLPQNIFALSEIGDYGVNVDLLFDYYYPKEIKTAEYTITDSGRFNQKYDIVRFNALYNGQYDVESLFRDGYRTLVVEIELEMKEVNEGYQYLFIYADTSRDTYLNGCKYSLGDDITVTSYTKITFYVEIPLANITNDYFVIRYGASGKGSDTWKNRTSNVFVGASRELPKTGNMWELSWNEEDSYYTATRLPLDD